MNTFKHTAQPPIQLSLFLPAHPCDTTCWLPRAAQTLGPEVHSWTALDHGYPELHAQGMQWFSTWVLDSDIVISIPFLPLSNCVMGQAAQALLPIK